MNLRQLKNNKPIITKIENNISNILADYIYKMKNDNTVNDIIDDLINLLTKYQKKYHSIKRFNIIKKPKIIEITIMINGLEHILKIGIM